MPPMLRCLFLPVLCRSWGCRLPNSGNWHNSYAQWSTPRGQRQRRPRLMTCLHSCTAQAPRLPRSSTAAAQTGTVSFQTGGNEERRQRIADYHCLTPNLWNTSCSLPLRSPYRSLYKNKQTKNFEIVLTNFCSFAYFLFSPSDIQKFTFCMNIFFTLIFFMKETFEDWVTRSVSFLLILLQIVISFLATLALNPKGTHTFGHLCHLSAQYTHLLYLQAD